MRCRVDGIGRIAWFKARWERWATGDLVSLDRILKYIRSWYSIGRAPGNYDIKFCALWMHFDVSFLLLSILCFIFPGPRHVSNEPLDCTC